MTFNLKNIRAEFFYWNFKKSISISPKEHEILSESS